MQIPIGQLANTLSELTHLLAQSIFIPGSKRQGNEPATKPNHPGVVVLDKKRKKEPDQPMIIDNRLAKGSLILTAGGQVNDREILEWIHLAGGRNAKITIIPSNQFDFAQAGERYRRLFDRFGANDNNIIDGTVFDSESIRAINQSNLVLIAGDGRRFTQEPASWLVNTLRDAWFEGKIIVTLGGVTAAVSEWLLPQVIIETASRCTASEFLQSLTEQQALTNHNQRALYLEQGSRIHLNMENGGYEVQVSEGSLLEIINHEENLNQYLVRAISTAASQMKYQL